MEDTSQPLETTLVRPSGWAGPPAWPAAPAAPEFTAGAVIGKALSTWWKNVVPFTALSVAAYLPLVGAYLWAMRTVLAAAGTPRPGDVPPSWFRAEGAVLVFVVAALLVTSAVLDVAYCGVAYGTFRHLRGDRARVGRMLAEGLRRAVPVFFASLVAWLVIGLGMVLLLVPGIMLASAWAAAIPACVVERLGPFSCLGRSAGLTRGHRVQVFLAVLAMFGITWAASIAVQVVAGVVVVAVIRTPEAPFVILAVSQLGTILFGFLPVIGAATAYHELRVAREGLGADHLAAVFE